MPKLIAYEVPGPQPRERIRLGGTACRRCVRRCPADCPAGTGSAPRMTGHRRRWRSRRRRPAAGEIQPQDQHHTFLIEIHQLHAGRHAGEIRHRHIEIAVRQPIPQLIVAPISCAPAHIIRLSLTIRGGHCAAYFLVDCGSCSACHHQYAGEQSCRGAVPVSHPGLPVGRVDCPSPPSTPRSRQRPVTVSSAISRAPALWKASR